MHLVVYDLFRDTFNPMYCKPDYGWVWPGKCLTAQSVVFPYPELTNFNVHSARWRLCWNPNIDNGANTAVRLVSAYSGPSNINQVASFFRANYTGPVNDTVDITCAMKDLIAQATIDQCMFEFIHQSQGDTNVGPIIYSSALEVVYE